VDDWEGENGEAFKGLAVVVKLVMDINSTVQLGWMVRTRYHLVSPSLARGFSGSQLYFREPNLCAPFPRKT